MAAAATATANGSQPLSKNAKRRQKKKQQKETPTEASSASAPIAQSQAESSTSASRNIDAASQQEGSGSSGSSSNSRPSQPSLIDLDNLQLDTDSEAYKAFSHVFSRFQQADPSSSGAQADADGAPQKGEVIYSDDEVASDSDASDASSKPKLSQRKQRKLQRLTVAELKQLVRRPEVVEWTDVTANDPRLLVQLKSQRNTVPVPPHWGQKRDYLQNKRGIEKAQYQLPHYIADTGIATMKDALKEKEADQSLKQKTRERVQPKMGKMDIDYQKLHDAFFKFQTRPQLTPYGETYYEGKENETRFKDRRPGDLSDELKEALSIPPLAPPPWLIAMQRYGPPPSYPHLKVPGLNAPIPEGAQWGFHPGGWGRPPVDEYGRPLYGDVLGSTDTEANPYADPVQKELWGQLEPEDSDEEDEEPSDADSDADEEGEGARADAEDGDATTRDRPDGLATPSGTASVASSFPGGLETPGYLELRKDSRAGPAASSSSTLGPDTAQPSPSAPKSLYQVLPERATAIQGFMGSERGYDLGPTLGSEDRGTKRKASSSDERSAVALDPAELEGLSEREVQKRLEQIRSEQARREGRFVGNVEGQDREGVAKVREEMSRAREAAEARRRDRGAAEREKFQF